VPAVYRYQSRPTLIAIANDLVTGMRMNNPIFDIFPIVPRNSTRLRWRIKDNYRGMMKMRGAGGEPTRIAAVGDKVYEERPGIFGEFATIDEVELLERGAGIPDDMFIPVDVKGAVRERQLQLTERQQNRIVNMCWTGALTGTLSIALPGGGVGFSMSFTLQTETPSVPWSTVATATPIKNLQDLQVEYGRGTSNNWGQLAKAYLNSVTANYLFSNTNAADWGGEKGDYGKPLRDIGGYNGIRVGRNIPELVIWDGGYVDDAGTFQMDIPDGKILVVAARPGNEKPGEFQMTYNAVTKNPGAYAFVKDFTTGPLASVPPKIDVHQGFNGGQVVERATQLLVMTVAS
jgi:hypothetical protein